MHKVKQETWQVIRCQHVQMIVRCSSVSRALVHKIAHFSFLIQFKCNWSFPYGSFTCLYRQLENVMSIMTSNNSQLLLQFLESIT